ncbi:MAG: hypothetical protein PUF04_09720 [bacterium]|nr:hypothetical protein [bacterium]
MGIREYQTMYNPQRKDDFFHAFPQHERYRAFFGIQQGVGSHEVNIDTDIADMSFDDLEVACQNVKIYLPEHLVRFKAMLNAYMEWQKSLGNNNADDLVSELFRIRFDLSRHFPEYIVQDPNEIISALALHYPPRFAYYEPIVAILCWAGLNYEMICSLAADSVTPENNIIKVQVEGRFFVIEDPLHVQLINAYLGVKDGQSVPRQYDAHVYNTGHFLYAVPSSRGELPAPVSPDTVRKRFSAALLECCSWYQGGFLGLQKSGYCHRMYAYEQQGNTDLDRYIQDNEPTAPASIRKIKALVDMYQIYKRTYYL